MKIEEAISHYEESEKINKELAEQCVSAMAKNHNLDNAEKCRQMIEWLRELQDRRKSDNEIPFGNNAPFSELDSIIEAYEIHGNHKKVVELLKELQERRKQPEIIYCGECDYREIRGVDGFCDHITGELIMVKKTDHCSWAERRPDETN